MHELNEARSNALDEQTIRIAQLNLGSAHVILAVSHKTRGALKEAIRHYLKASELVSPHDLELTERYALEAATLSAQEEGN